VVYLAPGTREHFLAMLDREWPEERARYERLFGERTRLARSVTSPTLVQIAGLARRHGIGDRRVSPIVPTPEPSQLALAM